MRAILKKLFPANSKRRKGLTKILSVLGIYSPRYNPLHNYLVEKSCEIQRVLPNDINLKNQPLISIVVPVYNTQRKYFDALLNSVLNQSYENFELIVADGSDNKKAIEYFDQIETYDKRIKRIKIENKGISENTNSAIKHSKGGFIALLDHDDILHPDALLLMVGAINQFPEGQMFYSDECKLTENGEQYFGPHYKPSYSPDLLSNLNYITHFTLIKREIFSKVGWFDKSKDGAQDFDMFLRISTYTDNIIHVPYVLYYWREAIGSTASSFENKKSIAIAGTQSLENYYLNEGVKAKVKIRKKTPGFYEAKITIPTKKVGVILNLENTYFTNNFIRHLQEKTKSIHNISWYGVKTNKSGVSEKAITVGRLADIIMKAKEENEIIVIIDRMALPKSNSWLDTLSAFLTQRHIGLITPTIIDYLGNVIYKGTVGTVEENYPIFKGMKYKQKTSFGDADWDRNVDSISEGIIAFESVLTPKVSADSFTTLFSELNKICESKGLYKTSLGRCLFREIFTMPNNFKYSIGMKANFNNNLSQYGKEDFEIIMQGQLPVTDKYNLMNEQL